MGVKGLSTYLSRDSRNFEEFYLHSTDVVIDAYNFLNYIYIKFGLFTQFGGEYLDLNKCITKIINAFRRCFVNPIFLFDGCHESVKFTTLIYRARGRLQTCRQLMKLAESKTNATDGSMCLPLLPPLANVVLAQTLLQLKVGYVVSDRESDADAVSLAIFLNCPVISNDSDLFITIPTVPSRTNTFLLPLTSLSFEPRAFNANQGHSTDHTHSSSRHYLTSQRFLPNGPGLGKLPFSQRPLFASLVGNDQIPSNVFLSAIPLTHGLRVSLTGKATREMRLNRRRAIFKRLIDWLAGFGENKEEPIRRLMSRLPVSSRERSTQLLSTSLQSYETNPSATASALLPFVNDDRERLSCVTVSSSNDSDASENCIVNSSLPDSSHTSDSDSQYDSTEKCPMVNDGDPSNSPSDTLCDPPNEESNPSIISSWPPKLVESFRCFNLVPTLLDAIYAKALVINCGVELIGQKKSIYHCSTRVRQLLYGLLLHLESQKGQDGQTPSSMEDGYLIEYMRKGSWNMQSYRIAVEPILPSNSTGSSLDKRTRFIQCYLTTAYPMFTETDDKILVRLNGIILLLGLWQSYDPDGNENWSNCSISLTLLLITIVTIVWLGAHQNPQSSCLPRSLMKHLSQCAHQLTPTADVPTMTKKSHTRLQLHVVHAFGELQSMYACLMTLGAVLDALMTSPSNDDNTEQVKCINLLPVCSVFPSGHLFHSIGVCLSAQTPSARLTHIKTQLIPCLLNGNRDKGDMAYKLLSRCLTHVQQVREGCTKPFSNSVTYIQRSTPDRLDETKRTQPAKPKRFTKRPKRQKPVVKTITDITVEVERLMIENGLNE